jgi:5-methylcytosine-specific restriction endonuclease McrA
MRNPVYRLGDHAMMICKKCGLSKEESEFSKHKSYKSGYRTFCRACERLYSKELRKRNPDFNKKHCAEYRKKNLERCRERARKAYQKIKEQRRIYRAQYYLKNRERLIAYSCNFIKTHPEYSLACTEKRRALKNHSCGDIDMRDFKRMCEDYGNKCLACGKQDKLAMDHVVPLTKGGVHRIDNIQPLCKSCNSKKYNKHIDYRPYLPIWVIGSVNKGEMNHGDNFVERYL